MPEVTVWPSPNGSPTATTKSPTRSLRRIGQRQRRAGSRPGSASPPHRYRDRCRCSLRLERAPVLQRHRDVVGAADHVVVGQDVALGRVDDHARTQRFARRARAALPACRRTGASSDRRKTDRAPARGSWWRCSPRPASRVPASAPARACGWPSDRGGQRGRVPGQAASANSGDAGTARCGRALSRSGVRGERGDAACGTSCQRNRLQRRLATGRSGRVRPTRSKPCMRGRGFDCIGADGSVQARRRAQMLLRTLHRPRLGVNLHSGRDHNILCSSGGAFNQTLVWLRSAWRGQRNVISGGEAPRRRSAAPRCKNIA